MKRWIAYFIVGIAFVIMSINSKAMAAEIVVIKACGEAIAMGSQDQVQMNALDNAKQKAVKKALARFIAPGGPNSLYAELAKDYKRYVVGKTIVTNKAKNQNKLLLFCNVPVDFETISKDIENKVSALQNKEQNANDEAIFLVRVTGEPVNVRINRFKLLSVYKNEFRRYGFSPAGGDEGENSLKLMNDTLSNYNGLSYEQFVQQVESDSKNNMMMTYVIVGEIGFTGYNLLNDSATAQAVCKLKVIKPASESQLPVYNVGAFNEIYSVSGRNLQEAVDVLIDKAASMSSKELAEITYNFWKKGK